MLLCDLNIIGHEGTRHICIEEGKIKDVVGAEKLLSSGANGHRLDLGGAIAFPGLINSHDHLDFNLFPQLGNKVYKSYVEWGADIQLQNKKDIDEVLNISKQLRVEWGIYKNLLNGITTVVNHGDHLAIKNPLINVYQDTYSLHSVHREKGWKFKLNRPFITNKPFVIHVGEGTDKASFEEINELINWNLFKRKLIAVHGVSMNARQAKSFEALIWCPATNFFLLNATANVNELKKETKILFGTDSTVSASWNLWEHLRLAKETNMLTGEELFDSLTSSPAATWKFEDRGVLTEGKTADVVVAKRKDKGDLLNSFFQLGPEDILLVMNKGEIILFDEAMYSQLKQQAPMEGYSKVYIAGTAKYVKGDLAGLINKIKEFAPGIKFPVEI